MDGQEGFIALGYAPADFADSEITRPSETYLDSGSQAPATIFSSAITNTQATHFRDVRDRHVNTVSYAQNWKRKIRDLFHHGNEDVLGFLAKPLSAHPTLGRDLVADLSGTNMNTVVEEILGESLHTFVGKIHKVYDLYREILDQTSQTDLRLRNKVYALDKIQPRLVTLMELGSSENTAELERQIELYLKSIYDQNNPEEEYKASLQLYKKFLVVKELVGMLRLSAGADREPICGICLNETVIYAVVPCGHTYCDTCSKKQYTQCFMCRQTIRDRIKIFFT
jgi:Zinc finger, C3HC4 type (RING finger)